MRAVAIVQARMGSTRLRGKVLADIGGRTMLARILERLRRSRLLDEVVVATTTSPNDDVVAHECEHLNVAPFRGPEDDVLERYHLAAAAFSADVVVRITGDCPLIDAGEVDRVIAAFLKQGPDYASNILKRTLPRGLDTEAISRKALDEAHTEATETYQRAHVTPFLYEQPSRFNLLSVVAYGDHAHLRWTVDTREDLELIRALYARGAAHASWQQIARLFEHDRSLAEINAKVSQKPLGDG